MDKINEETIDKENENNQETEEDSSVTILRTDSCPWAKFYSQSKSPWIGWTSSYEQVKQLISTFEMCTNTSFVREYRRNKGRKPIDCQNGHHVRYQDGRDPTAGYPELLQFDGVPFMNVNHERLECHRGYKTTKKDLKENEGKKRRPSFKGSKKNGCKAKIVIREIIRFPGFAIERNTKAIREFKSQKLRQALKINQDGVETEKRFYVYLPQAASHNHDNSEDLIHLIIDDRVKDKIYELVSEGIEAPSELMKRLNAFVNSNRYEWFPNGEMPEPTNRRFFPSMGAIRCHKNRALARDRRSRAHPQLDLRVKEKIYQLVSEGFETTTDLKVRLEEFVESNRFAWFPNGTPPEQSNKQFFPSMDTIRKHTKNALAGHRYSKVAQKRDSAAELRAKQINEANRLKMLAKQELEKRAGDCKTLLEETATAITEIEDLETLKEVQRRIEETNAFILSKTTPVDQKRKGAPKAVVATKVARLDAVEEEVPSIDVSDYVTIVLAQDEIRGISNSESGQILALETFNNVQSNEDLVENIILVVSE